MHVRKASSYYESLTRSTSGSRRHGKPPVKLVLVPDALEDEDMMEMLNAGLLEVDRRRRLEGEGCGRRCCPKIRVREDSCCAHERADRLGDPQGQPEARRGDLNDFYANFVKKQGVHRRRGMKQYMKQDQAAQQHRPAQRRRKRFEETHRALQRSTATQYGFDPLMLAAQGYQESQLDQNAKSHVGAIGVMQIMPATGAELKVGDIRSAEPNIHAGAKYMDQLMTRYFSDAKFDEQNRTLFAFASYNAGPGNIAQHAQGGREARARPRPVVQQRRDS